MLTNDLCGNNELAFPAVLHFGAILGLIEKCCDLGFVHWAKGGSNWHEASEELPFNKCHLANLGFACGK